jgi:hypothetical protein
MAKQTNIRRRGKAWVVSARVNGTQQWKSCRTRDEAELELARMIAQRARGETFVALPPKRDNHAPRHDSDRTGQVPDVCSLPTPRFQCFAAIALAGQTATSADVGSRPNFRPTRQRLLCLIASRRWSGLSHLCVLPVR